MSFSLTLASHTSPATLASPLVSFSLTSSNSSISAFTT